MIQQFIIDKASIIIITSQRQGSSSYTWSPRPLQPLGTQKPELQSRHQEDLAIKINFQRKGRKSIFCKNSKAVNLVSPGASSPLWLHQSFWNNPCSFMREANYWSTPSILCQYLSFWANGTFWKGERLLESRWNSEIEDTMESKWNIWGYWAYQESHISSFLFSDKIYTTIRENKGRYHNNNRWTKATLVLF